MSKLQFTPHQYCSSVFNEERTGRGRRMSEGREREEDKGKGDNDLFES